MRTLPRLLAFRTRFLILVLVLVLVRGTSYCNIIILLACIPIPILANHSGTKKKQAIEQDTTLILDVVGIGSTTI